jgi:hypothetical protein
MLSLDCTNEGRLAKNGNTHPSKIRNWQANVIAFDDTELNEWLMQAIEEGSGQFFAGARGSRSHTLAPRTIFSSGRC